MRITNPERKWQHPTPTPRPVIPDVDEITEVQESEQAQATPAQALPSTQPATEMINSHVLQQASEIAQSPRFTFQTTQLPAKPRQVDVDGTLAKRGRRKIVLHKRIFQGTQLSLNGFFIFFTWYFAQYWYVILPIISAAIALNVVMIISLICKRTWTAIRPEEKITPETPESLVYIVPCYNETKEELTRSLDSLIAQQKVDDHKQAIVIICDGKVRGPGMEKTTADYLLDDILKDRTLRKRIPGGYTAWDSRPMDVTVQSGRYKSLPYFCIVKEQNQGKRDGLIAVRSFLYNFNRRQEKPATIMNQEYFDTMASWMLQDAGIEHVDDLIGMDADTVFADECAYELVQTSRFKGTMGVAGYVAVDWKNKLWGFWRLYQNTEYTITQCLRRLHQGRVTHKVSCLPGACQLLKICEETCGDRVLVELFGRCPDFEDGLLKHIQASASEDRNHVCHMLTARPESKTRQALRAKAYTDVPVTWAVYLSQRRRWSLGATGNDWLLCWAPGMQWFERILSIVSALTWFLTPFVFAAYGSFIYAIVVHPSTTLLAITSIMLVPIVYYICIPAWHAQSWKEVFQFWTGLLIYIFFGPFCRMIVLCYSVKNIDSFGWGKTRQVIAEDGEKSGKLAPAGLPDQTKSTESLPERSPSVGDDHLNETARDIGDEEKTVGT
ncbi:unnamed protein product [Zymoseptoria tritici ST99CH_3D1]|nr:unnamed protein product [Zymoseptoria tritici ST99CH_3D1]